MEESKSAQENYQLPDTVPPPPPPPQQQQNLETSQHPPIPPQHTKKKRMADHADTQDTHFSHLCALVKDLRPHFVEVLQTPDFRTSKAADEIRKKMKQVMDIYNQMPSVDPATVGVSKKPVEEANKDGEKQAKRHHSSEGELVGNSNMGWNFLTYPGTPTVYYGVTKESYRLAKEKLGKTGIPKK